MPSSAAASVLWSAAMIFFAEDGSVEASAALISRETLSVADVACFIFIVNYARLIFLDCWYVAVIVRAGWWMNGAVEWRVDHHQWWLLSPFL